MVIDRRWKKSAALLLAVIAASWSPEVTTTFFAWFGREEQRCAEGRVGSQPGASCGGNASSLSRYHHISSLTRTTRNIRGGETHSCTIDT